MEEIVSVDVDADISADVAAGGAKRGGAGECHTKKSDSIPPLLSAAPLSPSCLRPLAERWASKEPLLSSSLAQFGVLRRLVAARPGNHQGSSPSPPHFSPALGRPCAATAGATLHGDFIFDLRSLKTGQDETISYGFRKRRTSSDNVGKYLQFVAMQNEKEL